MAELTFKSAGVGTREIDLSGPADQQPSGIPAGVIGTATEGPAFVPISVANINDFIAKFGSTDGEKFGPLAVNEWLKNSQAVTYVRILGAGDGTKRSSTDGSVTRAGFVVGDKQVEADGNIGRNPGVGLTTKPYSGSVGRTYLFGAFMSQSSDIFVEAGIKGGANTNDVYEPTKAASPILRGMVMAPSGVLLSLSSSAVPNNAPVLGGGAAGAFFSGSTQSRANGTLLPARLNANSSDAGWPLGAVDKGASKNEFVVFLNGLEPTGEHPNVLTASFDPTAANYFLKVMNTDPTLYEKAGHLLYAHYNVYTQYAAVTGSGLINNNSALGNKECAAFIVTSSLGQNAGSATVPNFEAFKDRFAHARSPWITSQEFGGKPINLFKVHARSDGANAGVKYKVSIENITKVANSLAADQYGRFDLVLRSLQDNDRNPVVIEAYRGLSLDPGSDRYIARVIGDQNLYYDFDKKAGNQKLAVEGLFPNKSNRIRVEIGGTVKTGDADSRALPCGFRGPRHLVTSGSSITNAYRYPRIDARTPAGLTPGQAGFNVNPLTGSGGDDIVRRIVEPPIPFRLNVAVGQSPKQTTDAALYWGVQFEVNDNKAQPNKNNKYDNQFDSRAKYFPDYQTSNRNVVVGDNAGTADSGGTVLDSDRFNNNRFTLERVQVKTQSNDTPDPKEWHRAAYRRDGTISDTSMRFLNVEKDFADLATRKYLKFSFFLQGGFDGVDIFNKDKSKLTNNAAKREMDDSTNQGGTNGPTVQAYRKAIDVLEEKSNADIQLLAIPGARHESITDYAIDAVEDRFDAMYIMDIEERDVENNVVTSSVEQKVGVTNTASSFSGRNLDSSFAAAYFPDVVVEDPGTATNVQCPPSVAILGAYSLNDSVAHPWFAPAGFSRGALKDVIEAQVKLSRNNLDTLYDADINPVTAFPHTPGVVAFGQKTLLAAQSALDRVNVRRLLIEVRRQVKGVANKILFEPNREDTLNKFSAAVQPILARIQAQQGLDRYKVIIDTTTTTQADVENNTVRGKIFLQPTRSVEFISLDFVVTNAGAQI